MPRTALTAEQKEAARARKLERRRARYAANRELILAKYDAAYHAARHAANRERINAEHRRRYRARREQHQAKRREYREANREAIRAKSRAHYARNKERMLVYKIAAKYGIHPAQHAAMISGQRGACAICGKPCNSRSRLSVDHDHVTGFVRGMLCNGCNIGLGKFRDDPERLRKAAAYIEAGGTQAFDIVTFAQEMAP
jgi:hypothetical protein